MDMLGGLISGGMKLAGDIMQGSENRAAQEDFAKHGLGWRVADAKAAGINPLAALGAQLNSFQTSVGAGTGVAEAGQDIARAMHAYGDPSDRAAAVAKSKLDLERSGLENDLLRTRLMSDMRKVSAPGTPPGVQFGPADKYPSLTKDWRAPDGSVVRVIDEKASGGYLAKGIPGSIEATATAGDPFRRGAGVGTEPWHWSDVKRWIWPDGSALFGPN